MTPRTKSTASPTKKARGRAVHAHAAGSSAEATHDPAHPRHAHAMDDAVQAALIARLRRVEGQVRGVQGMVADKRYCADVLVQLSAIQEALRGVSRELLRNHLAHCATHELTRGGSHATAMVDELVDLMHKHNR